jgi:predicted AAA+ superfamily ATPase
VDLGTDRRYVSSGSDGLLPRAVTPNILAALAVTPVVVVNGPRQAGKTTLVRSLPYLGTSEIVSLDEPTARSAAVTDPRAFVERSIDPLVIDEAQLEPVRCSVRSRPRSTQTGAPGASC